MTGTSPPSGSSLPCHELRVRLHRKPLANAPSEFRIAVAQ